MRTSGLGIVVGTLLATASGVFAWPFFLDGGVVGEDDGRAVALAPDGDAIVTGRLLDAVGRTFATLRLDGNDGSELWRRTFAAGGSTSVIGTGYAAVMAGDGTVLVAGTTMSDATFSDYTIAKLDAATGDTVWRTDVTGPGNGGGLTYDQGLTVAVDGAGDVLGTGFVHADTPVYEADWVTVKLSGVDGTELWRAYATGTGSGIGGGDYTYGIAVDSAGNPVSGGIFRNASSSTFSPFDIGVVKYDGTDGTQLWRRDIRGPATNPISSSLSDIITLPGDDVVIGGRLHANLPIADGFYVARLAGTTGATVWSRLLELSGSASGVASDAAGDVLAVGELGRDFAVVKLANADGTELWRRLESSTVLPDGSSTGHALAVAVDGNGDVVSAGYLDASLTVTKHTGSDGSLVWRYSLAGTVGTYSYGYDVTVDDAGNVAATGVAQTLWGAADLVVVKLNGATGAPIDCGNGTMGPGEQCDDGNLVSGDGCDATCTLSACGNRIVAGGEQCDDGNWEAGDGCSPVCLFEECGNGAVDPGEDCDDGNLVSGDGCEATCLYPTCVGGVAIEQLSVTLKHRPRGDRYTVKGRLAFAAGTPASGFDPAGRGVQLLIEDLGAGDRAVIGLTRATAFVPAANAPRCASEAWKSSGTTQKWTSKDPADRLPPGCADDSGNGLRQLVFKDRRAKGDGVTLTAKGEGYDLGVLTGPLRVTIVPSVGSEGGLLGACAAQAFAASECRRDAAGSLSCRRR